MKHNENDLNDESIIPADIKEEFAGIMMANAVGGALCVAALLAATALYWAVVFDIVVKIEPAIYTYFGIGQ